MKKTILLWLLAIMIIGVQNINAQVTGIGCKPTLQTLVAGPGDTLLYGMTTNGGSNNDDYGVLFSFNPSTGTYTELKDFDGTKGKWPMGNLYYCSTDELFYGMTSQGGANDYGVIFKYDLNTNTLTRIYSFDGTHGYYPYGSLINIPENGNTRLYGVTYGDGS